MEIRKRKNNHNSTKKKSEFEFCKVCNLNHDQGPRHKYFPNHKKSLATFLSRFQKKISDIRFFLKSPTTLRPEYASQNRFWCVLCDTDIDELGSSFAWYGFLITFSLHVNWVIFAAEESKLQYFGLISFSNIVICSLLAKIRNQFGKKKCCFKLKICLRICNPIMSAKIIIKTGTF